MESSVVTRAATRADMSAIGTLAAMLVQLHHDYDPLRFMAATAGTAHGYGSYLGTQLQEANVVVLVAEVAGVVIGYSYAGIEGIDYMALRGPAGALYDIMVDPARRGHGVGAQLLDATLAALTTLGAPRVVLSTAEQNASAQRLFARAGFRRTMVEMTREA